MTDVLVVGGGPAGLAAAIAAARRGFKVIVADGCQPEIDKACGECVLPEGQAALLKLGSPLFRFPIAGIRFVDGDLSFSAEFRNGCGSGIRRTVLHSSLVRLAERSGVDLQWGRAVSEPKGARWIIAADGAGSRLRSSVGRIVNEKRRYGFRLHYGVKVWTNLVEVHWAEGCQMYLTPVASDVLGVAVVSRDPKLRVANALERFPAVRERLVNACELSRERGALTCTRVLDRVTRGNIALVGDASGSVDAITADGLSLAFRQAVALGRALKRGDLEFYERAHRRLAARPRFMANALLLADRFPAVRRPLFRMMAGRPGIFEKMLAFHTAR